MSNARAQALKRLSSASSEFLQSRSLTPRQLAGLAHKEANTPGASSSTRPWWAEKAIELLDRLKAEEVATLVWASVKLKCCHNSNVFPHHWHKHLVNHVTHLADAPPKSVSQIVLACAHLSVPVGPTVELAERIKSRLAELDGRSVANVIWSLAKLSAPRDLVEDIGAAVLALAVSQSESILQSESSWKAGELVTIIWSLQKLSLLPSEHSHLFAQAIHKLIVQEKDGLKLTTFANGLYALAACGCKTAELLPIARHLPRNVTTVNSADLASIAWSMAKGKVQDDSVSQVLYGYACDLHSRNQLSCQALAVTIWAVSETVDGSSYDALRSWAHASSKRMTAGDLSTACLGLARGHIAHGIKARNTSDMQTSDYWSSNRVVKSLSPWRQSSSRDLAATFAQFGHCLNNSKVYEALDESGVSNMLWAFAVLRFVHPNLQRVLNRAVMLAKTLASEQLGMISWACLQLNLDFSPMLKSLNIQNLRECGKEGVPLIQIAWASVSAGWYCNELQALLDKCKTFKPRDLCTADRRRFLSFHLVLSTDAPDAFRQTFLLEDEVQTEVTHADWCEQATIDDVSFGQKTHANCFQVDILRIVNSLLPNEHVVSEHFISDGLSIDIALPKLKIGIEVDGPSHFMYKIPNLDPQPSALSLLKRRLLEQRGWKVINIDFVEAAHRTRRERFDLVKEAFISNGISI